MATVWVPHLYYSARAQRCQVVSLQRILNSTFRPLLFSSHLLVGYTAFLVPTHGRVHRFFSSHLLVGYTAFEHCYSSLLLYAQ
nr:MAG TPA: hypothetical protein [Caudoviricetes sp.]